METPNKLYCFLILLPTLLFAETKEEFTGWWSSYRVNLSVPEELRDMEDYVVGSELINQFSEFWHFLNKKNITQLSELGFDNFKQTVCTNYFTWVVDANHPYASNLKNLVPSPLPIELNLKEVFRLHPLFSKSESYNFNRVTELFLNYIYAIGSIGDLEIIEEPLVGNPPFLLFNNRRISQDIFNSILEKNAIQTGCNLNHVSTVYEVGAGSGRTAFTLLTLYPHLKYVIIDIPPALYISQTYLSRVFSERNFMKFRPFSTFKEIEEEFSQADICFITPDQLNLLQRRDSSLFLAIDCIHEMKPETIEMYFNHAGRLCDWIYFKCWQKTVMPFDNIVYNDDSYPVLQSWKKIFHEPTVVPSDFFHAMYLIE